MKAEGTKVDRKVSHMMLNTLNGFVECYHCGEDYNFNACLPAPLNVAASIMKTWAKNHRRCKPSLAGTALKEKADVAWRAWEAKKRTEPRAIEQLGLQLPNSPPEAIQKHPPDPRG